MPLFGNVKGKPLRPSAVSSGWGELAEDIGIPDVTSCGPRQPMDRERADIVGV